MPFRKMRFCSCLMLLRRSTQTESFMRLFNLEPSVIPVKRWRWNGFTLCNHLKVFPSFYSRTSTRMFCEQTSLHVCLCIPAPCCTAGCQSSPFKQSRLFLPACFPGNSGQRADMRQLRVCVCVCTCANVCYTVLLLLSLCVCACPVNVSELRRGGRQVCKPLTRSQDRLKQKFTIWNSALQ